MNTLKEKWIEALPFILGGIFFIIFVFLFVSIIFFIVDKIREADKKDLIERQEMRINEIKKCLDNNLDVIQAVGGNWMCIPKK